MNAAMTSKRRHNKGGKGKLLNAYQCAQCGRWHLGNTPGTRIENLMRIFDRLPPSDRTAP
jgi:hypothetical protein